MTIKVNSIEELILLEEDGKLNGIYPDIDDNIYHHKDCPGYSRSDLQKINKSYSHYVHSKDYPLFKKSRDMEFGSAFHEAVLLPEEFKQNYVTMPPMDRRTKEGKEKYAEFQSKNKDKKLLSPPEMDYILYMREAVCNFPAASRMLYNDNVLRENSIWVTIDNVLCKCKPDLYCPGNFIADLKTTQDASPYEFKRSVHNYYYHMQAAFYHDCILELTGEDLPFYFIAVEKTPPYGVAMYKLSDELMMKGRAIYQDALYKARYVEKFGIPETVYPEDIQIIDVY